MLNSRSGKDREALRWKASHPEAHWVQASSLSSAITLPIRLTKASCLLRSIEACRAPPSSVPQSFQPPEPLGKPGPHHHFGAQVTCETPKKSNFLKNGKMVISVKIRNFFRSRMTKRTSPLESSREIQIPHRISSNSETVGISRVPRHRVSGSVKRLVRDM